MNGAPWIDWKIALPVLAFVAVILAVRWGGHPCEKYEERTVVASTPRGGGWKEYKYKVCILK